MNDLVSEIKEELREETLYRVWDRYRFVIFAAIASVIIATGSTVYWRAYEKEAQQLAGTALFETASAEATAPTSEILAGYDEAAAHNIESVKALALLRKAALLISENRVDEALEVYRQAASDDSLPSDLQELASLMYLYNVAGNEKILDANNSEELLRLSQNSPWRYSAIELMAFENIHQNKLLNARQQFQQLADAADAPSSLRQRANEMLGLIHSQSASGEGVASAEELNLINSDAEKSGAE